MDLVVATILGIVIGVFGITSALISLFQERSRRRKEKEREPTLQAKISELTTNLESSVKTITMIEEEVKARKRLVDQLEDDAQRHKNLLATNREQLESIIQTLSIPIQKESRKSFWLNTVVSFVIALVFFALGFFLGRK